MDRCYFIAANMVALRYDRRRLNQSVRGVLGSIGVRS
jgi:hypothetical protein